MIASDNIFLLLHNLQSLNALFRFGGNNNTTSMGKKSMKIMQTNLICIVQFSSQFSSCSWWCCSHTPQLMEQLVDENCLMFVIKFSASCHIYYCHGWWLWMKAFREDVNKAFNIPKTHKSHFSLSHMCKQSKEINSHSFLSSLINITNYTNFTNLFKPELTLIYFKRNFLSYIYLFVYFTPLSPLASTTFFAFFSSFLFFSTSESNLAWIQRWKYVKISSAGALRFLCDLWVRKASTTCKINERKNIKMLTKGHER